MSAAPLVLEAAAGDDEVGVGVEEEVEEAVEGVEEVEAVEEVEEVEEVDVDDGLDLPFVEMIPP